MNCPRICVIEETTHPELLNWCRLGLWRSLIVIFSNITDGHKLGASMYKNGEMDEVLDRHAQKLLPSLIKENVVSVAEDGSYKALYDFIVCPSLLSNKDYGTQSISYTPQTFVDALTMHNIFGSGIAQAFYFYGSRIPKKSYMQAMEKIRHILSELALTELSKTVNNAQSVGEESCCNVEIFIPFACIPENEVIQVVPEEVITFEHSERNFDSLHFGTPTYHSFSRRKYL